MENIDDYLSNLSIESLMDLSETTSSSTFEENSIVRELISRFKLSQSNFTWGLIVLRDNILIEITKRYIQLNIKPMNEELTPHIEYHPNGNVWIKGQHNSNGHREGLWEGFHLNGNIEGRTTYKDGKEDGIEEWFYENGNIKARIPFKGGKGDGIEEWLDEQGNITQTRHWKDGELIKTTKH
jgi:antitoxin component YwqK of YwqJK toxin-antitoxin module